jgi:phosphoribosylanthranilate isomerase
MMFRIKICGITTVEDARVACEAGADAVGLNFYASSPRCVTVDQASAICEALSGSVVKVGLFVNTPAADVARICGQLGLDLVQLHGDEPPEYVADLGDWPVMRAFRLDARGIAPIGQYLSRCRALGCLPRLTLIDSSAPGQYGGTGRPADWQAVAQYPCESWHPPLILAGGLTPANVAQAIQSVRPFGVDTASGVEVTPGRKSADRVRQFVLAARAALDVPH